MHTRQTLLIAILTAGLPVLTQAQTAPPPAYANGSWVNYIRTWAATAPESDPAVLPTRGLRDVKQTTTYIDGLGRPIQAVTKQGSLNTGSTAADIVTAVVYDAFGREQYKYLPFAANAAGGNASINDGAFKLNPFQQQVFFYNKQLVNEPGEINLGAGQLNYSYSQVNYETSPLNRVNKTLAPGVSWVGADKGVSSYYLANTAKDSVRVWLVTTGTVGNFSTYSSPGAYAPGMLYKSVTIDEHGKQVVQFQDKDNRILLKKVQLTSAGDDSTGIGHTGWLCTYYIYDGMGNLSAVLQPRGVELIASSWVLTDATILAEQCFRYEYDQQRRMILKQVPGAQPLAMIYDARDRLVMSQDGNLRSKNKWNVTFDIGIMKHKL